MPNRLQWWRDRLKHDYALIGAGIVAFLLAALLVSMDRTELCAKVGDGMKG
jgi:hypothetical protein